MAIRFHILVVSQEDVGYAGVDRLAPSWRENASSAYLRACDEIADAMQGLMNQQDARRLAEIIRAEGVAVDVVGVETVTTPERQRWPLLGYDVTYFSYHSVLRAPGVFSVVVDQSDAWRSILRFIDRTVQEQLNRRRLFDSFDHASRLAEVLRALRALQPDRFEPEEGWTPAVHAVYDVSP